MNRVMGVHESVLLAWPVYKAKETEVKKIILAGMLCLGSTATMAADSGFYFDIGLGQSLIKGLDRVDFDATLSSLGYSISSSKFDDSVSSWSTAVGYRIMRYVAADISFVDLGDTKYRANFTDAGVAYLYKNDQSVSGPAVAAMGILPIGKWFELHGRAGVLFAKTNGNAYLTNGTTSASTSYSARTNNVFFGVEGAFNMTENFSIRLGVNRYKNVGDEEVTGKFDFDAINLGVTFRQ